MDHADAQSGKYAFTADLDGDYKLCFQDIPRPGAYINWGMYLLLQILLDTKYTQTSSGVFGLSCLAHRQLTNLLSHMNRSFHFFYRF